MRARRPAFTVFQLLVVIAIAALLFGLFLPAVLRLRSAAARAQSTNNLKQIALGCHNYADVNQHFPSGNDANNFSAATHLLPYIEQDNLYKQLDLGKPSDDKANAPVRGAVIKVFLNPRDPIMGVEPGVGATNYLFNAGLKPGLTDNDGLFFQDSKVKFADISDGTSNTVLAGETLKGDGGKTAKDVQRQHVVFAKDALDKLADESGVQEWKDGKMIAGNRCAAWIDGRFLQGTFNGTRMLNDVRPDVTCDGAGGLSGLRTLEDALPVAMGDGAVRMIKTTIAIDTWKALVTRNGGEVVPNDF